MLNYYEATEQNIKVNLSHTHTPSHFYTHTHTLKALHKVTNISISKTGYAGHVWSVHHRYPLPGK